MRVAVQTARRGILVSGDLVYVLTGHCSVGWIFPAMQGSERAGRTGNAGARLREMVAINTSLMTLGRCLEVRYPLCTIAFKDCSEL